MLIFALRTAPLHVWKDEASASLSDYVSNENSKSIKCLTEMSHPPSLPNIYKPYSTMAITILDPQRLGVPDNLVAGFKRLAERMPGFKHTQQLFCSRIAICGKETPEIIELAKTLHLLGAKVDSYCLSDSLPFCTSPTSSTELLPWRRLACALDQDSVSFPKIIIDFGGKATQLIHEGVKAEREFRRTGRLLDPTLNDDPEQQIMLSVINEGLEMNPTKYHCISHCLVGVCEMTTEGAKRAYQMQAKGTLPSPVINVKGSLVKSKFGYSEGLAPYILDFLHAQNGHYAHQLLSEHLIAFQNKSLSDLGNCLDSNGLSDLLNFKGRHLLDDVRSNLNICHYLPVEAHLPDGFLIKGKVAVICGYGSKGRCAAAAMKQAGARVIVTEVNSRRAYQAHTDGFEVCNQEDVVATADIIITATGKKETIMVSDMTKMKNNTLIMDIGHFDNEIDMAGLEAYPGAKKIPIRHGYICYFPESKNAIRVLVLPDGGLTSYTNTMGVIGLLALLGTMDTGMYDKEVYVLSEDYDEMVAALHLEHHGIKLTKGSTSYTTGSASCATVTLDGQEHLRKRKASLMNRLALPNMKLKCA